MQEFGCHIRYSEYSGKYFYTSIDESSANAGTPQTFSRLVIKFYIKSKLSQKKIYLDEVILDRYAMSSVGKMNYAGFTFLKHLRLVQENVAGVAEPIFWIRKLKFIAMIPAVIKGVTPHLGMNKMDISKHISWQGGYWVHFDGPKFDEAAKHLIDNPAIIHQTRIANLKQTGQMQNTGDQVVDACWNLMGVKYERVANGKVRGWFPFMDCRVLDYNGSRSSLDSLKNVFKTLQDEKAAGNIKNGEVFETVLGHVKRAVDICNEAPNGAMLYMTYNTYGATMGRIPSHIWKFLEWDSIKFEFSAKEGVHQRETNSSEALSDTKPEFSIQDISSWTTLMADLKLPAQENELFKSDDGCHKMFWYCESSKWFASISTVGESSFSFNMFVPESHILDILRSK